MEFADIPRDVMFLISSLLPVEAALELRKTCKKISGMLPIEQFWSQRAEEVLGGPWKKEQEKDDIDRAKLVKQWYRFYSRYNLTLARFKQCETNAAVDCPGYHAFLTAETVVSHDMISDTYSMYRVNQAFPLEGMYDKDTMRMDKMYGSLTPRFFNVHMSLEELQDSVAPRHRYFQRVMDLSSGLKTSEVTYHLLFETFSDSEQKEPNDEVSGSTGTNPPVPVTAITAPMVLNILPMVKRPIHDFF